MKWSSRIELYELGFCSIFGGCIAASGAILYRSGFDQNAILTLIGAFAGVAAVVLVTQGQEERQSSAAKRREAAQIKVFLGILKTQINTQAKPLFDEPFDVARAQTACLWLSMTIDQTREYAEQVARFAVHLDFATRAHVSSLIADCGVSANTLRAVMAAEDAYPPNPDWNAARRTATNVQNAIELAKL